MPLSFLIICNHLIGSCVSAAFSLCIQSEHIPSEDEMEEWESKMKQSETWLDRGINKVLGSLFGREE